MLDAVKLYPEDDTPEETEVEEGFTGDLITTRRGEIQAFATALRNEALIEHVSSADGDETFGDLIRLAVNDYGVSQRQLAKAIDVNLATVGRWVAGSSRAPRLSRRSILLAIGLILDHDIQTAQPSPSRARRSISCCATGSTGPR